VFFIDKIGCFQYLAPLGEGRSRPVLKKSFEIMDAFNKNKEISRMENIEEKDTRFYEKLGFNCRIKSYDYLCERADLARLRGNRFKSKRASCNYFLKHYTFEYSLFTLKYKKDCLLLYDRWMKQRRAKSHDPLYQGMLQDSRVSLEKALDHFSDLNLRARIVRVNREVKGFTFGYPLNKDAFCILYEITDLAVKGLAQFIFRAFSDELKNFKYINVMDDSGLENLKKVKLSYKPVRFIPSFTVTRIHA
jgi:hypothetical protein